MGIFSFLGKKDRQSESSESEKDTSRRSPDTETGRPSAPRPSSTRTAARTAQQLDAARATAEKIDAIESEMTSELGRRRKSAESGVAPAKTAPAISRDTQPANNSGTSSSILPGLGETTGFGLDTRAGNVVVESSETPPAIEEAAILFANEQNDMVEQMLLSAMHDPSLGDKSKTVWRMLFDLYQITGNQAQFEHLSIDFAAKFETSPPAWDDQCLDQPASTVQPTGATPALTFSGKLDSAIAKQLDRAQKLSEKNGALRLEFARVTEVQADGCALLLAALKKLQKSGLELILVGAPELATKIRGIIETGRRDETDAPWLLLLEILQLLNREQEFEETSIDYCITFEVSPPAFVAPKKVSTAVEVQESAGDEETEKFMMPAVVDGRSDVINTINVFVNRQDPAIIDCTNLKRIDFSAAGQLLSLLAPLAGKGKTVEFYNVNSLVEALFQVIGLRDVVRVTLRKH